MQTEPKLRCFVAMAFGHKDTDHVYNSVIAPLLRQLDVVPVRVDKVEHNRNINDVIMDELKVAEIVIADLTYARPSVYFEAGFAERSVPVIYTARRDHLSPKVRDRAGNRRVHFDVSMRNIIDWSTPPDDAFSKRLKLRLQHVLRPLKGRRRESLDEDRAATLFSASATEVQIEQLSRVAITAIDRAGFSEVLLPNSLAPSDSDDDAFFQWHRDASNGNFLYGFSTRDHKAHAVAITIRKGFTPREVLKFANVWEKCSLQLQVLKLKGDRGPHTVTCSLILCSPSRIALSGVKRLLTKAHVDTYPNSLVWHRTTSTDGPSFAYRIVLVGSVRSPDNLATRLAEALGSA